MEKENAQPVSTHEIGSDFSRTVESLVLLALDDVSDIMTPESNLLRIVIEYRRGDPNVGMDISVITETNEKEKNTPVE